MLPVKPVFLVYQLPKYFNGWLRAVCFFSWHIQIINEHQQFLASWWTKYASLSPASIKTNKTNIHLMYACKGPELLYVHAIK